MLCNLITVLLPIHVLGQADQPPVADAGPDLSLYRPGYDAAGCASDADGDSILSWAWTIECAPVGSTPSVFQDFAPTPAFIETFLAPICFQWW